MGASKSSKCQALLENKPEKQFEGLRTRMFWKTGIR